MSARPAFSLAIVWACDPPGRCRPVLVESIIGGQDLRRLDDGSELKSQSLKGRLLPLTEMQLICDVVSGHGDPAVRQHARTLEGNPRKRGPRDGHVTVTQARLEAHMTPSFVTARVSAPVSANRAALLFG